MGKSPLAFVEEIQRWTESTPSQCSAACCASGRQKGLFNATHIRGHTQHRKTAPSLLPWASTCFSGLLSCWGREIWVTPLRNWRTCSLHCTLPIHYSGLKIELTDCASSVVQTQPGFLKPASAWGQVASENALLLLVKDTFNPSVLLYLLMCCCIQHGQTTSNWGISFATVFWMVFFVYKRFLHYLDNWIWGKLV